MCQNLRDSSGRFVKGVNASPETQFKKGQHWREPKPYWDKTWLEEHYKNKHMSAREIAQMFGVTENNILYWLSKHNIKTRKMSDIRSLKYWGVSGADNPMWGKVDESNPNWKGGVTPERQSIYVSKKWKDAVKEVWKRDNAQCQKCKIKKDKSNAFHVHHIKDFTYVEDRCNPKNLILLCEKCHHWIHSRRNKNGEYIQQIRYTGRINGIFCPG